MFVFKEIKSSEVGTYSYQNNSGQTRTQAVTRGTGLDLPETFRNATGIKESDSVLIPVNTINFPNGPVYAQFVSDKK